VTDALAAELVAQPGPATAPRWYRSSFWPYLATKLAGAVVSFLVLLVIGFTIFNVMPSDPVATLARQHPTTPRQMAALRHQLGLDLPVWHRFIRFFWNTLQGKLGDSWQLHQSVGSLIAERFWPTVLLVGSATVISVTLGLWLGIRSGWRHGSAFDRTSSGVSLVLWSVPTFWLGLILLVVFTTGPGPIPANLFPAGQMSTAGYQGAWIAHAGDTIHHLILPCLTLVLVIFAQYVTIMRSSIIDELGAPYLLTARAKGLRDDDVRRKHAVPNALLPSVTVIFLQVGTILAGAITVETVYSWQGLGLLTYEALQIPDIPLLEGTFVVLSGSVIVMNLLADMLYRVLDPRVRAQ
jgi:peptide/nickel transport system permease protein